MTRKVGGSEEVYLDHQFVRLIMLQLTYLGDAENKLLDIFPHVESDKPRLRNQKSELVPSKD